MSNDADLKRLRRISQDSPEKEGSYSEATHSTHKARAAWFGARETWPMREVPSERLTQARNSVATCLRREPVGSRWVQAGPTNIGGRSTSVSVDPEDPDRILLGAAGGGVWSTDDGGATWGTAWHSEPSLNIGSLCRDPNDPAVVYCGTGEANLSADSHPGVGIYRSMDGGATWAHLAPAQALGLPRRIGRIAVDPFDSSHLLAGGVGHRHGDPQGLFESRDGGIGWAKVISLFAGPMRCHDIVFHPTRPDTVYVAVHAAGSATGIHRSDDGGLTWQHLTSGMPDPSMMTRIAVAIAPSDPDVLYAQCSDATSAVLGVFRSANGGATWKDVAGNHFANERQMSYNNTIAVDPTDPDTAICGGVDLHLTRNGGTTWKQVTRWNAQRGGPEYAHADQHEVVFHPTEPGRIYAANDGGLDVSFDGGSNWENRSDGLATNMFYDLAAAANFDDMWGGGMQDNGTCLTIDGDPSNFLEVTGGDGGFALIDPNNPSHVYTSWQFMTIHRFLNGNWRFDTGPVEAPRDRPWMAFLAMDPARPKRVFVGARRMWRSTNDGIDWKAVSGVLDGSFITCIEVSRADPDRVYCGTENGGIFVSHDGGSSWSGNMASSLLPGFTVTRLRTTAQDPDVVYATTANFGSSHVWRSVDGAGSWADVDGGALPDVPHHAIAIPSTDGDTVIVASDVGVHVTRDGAASWTDLTLNLPTVMVVDLVLQEASSTLFAATYGRSTWSLDVTGL